MITDWTASLPFPIGDHYSGYTILLGHQTRYCRFLRFLGDDKSKSRARKKGLGSGKTGETGAQYTVYLRLDTRAAKEARIRGSLQEGTREKKKEVDVLQQ